MALKLPKPLHGWRAFWGEVGIIVLGVLIALAAQQLAENVQDRQRLAKADRAIALELGEAIGQAQVKIATYGCAEKQFDRLAQIIAEAERTGRLPPLGELPQPKRFTWPSGAWETLQNGTVVALEPPERLQGLSGVYSFIQLLDREQYREIEVWTDLFQLVGPGRSFSAADAAASNRALREARMLNRLVTGHALRLTQLTNSYGIAVDRPSMEMYIKGASLRDAREMCERFGSVPENYGEAPLRPMIEKAIRRPIHKPDRQ